MEQIIDAATVGEFIQSRFQCGKIQVREMAGTITLIPLEGKSATENSYRITAEEKRKRDDADAAYLNMNAERLNAEMADVLRYQKDIF